MNATSDDDSSERTCEPSQGVPSQGVLLGIDYGTKRIGIAICTSNQTIASPLENYDRQSAEVDGKHLTKLAREYRAVGLVVGLPVHMSGDEGGKAKEARHFGNWLASVTTLPLAFWDERYTSSIAEMYLHQGNLTKKKRKKRLDMLAAQIMLKSFLDAEDRMQPPSPIE